MPMTWLIFHDFGIIITILIQMNQFNWG